MRILHYITLLGFLLCTWKCKKEPMYTGSTNEPSTFSAIPSISFHTILPTTVKEYEDSITITITYIDGDGDLGENDASIANLFVKDLRVDVTYEYRIPELSPEGSSIAIQGNLPIILKNTAITDGSTSETVMYEIYITDRAGNSSNIVTTTSITIEK